MLPLDVDRILDQLTLEEKASLCLGHDDWFTQAIARLGVPAVEVGDGPHGLRRETRTPMVWIPATGFPTGSALGSTWDRKAIEAATASIAAEAKVQGVAVVLGPGVNMKRTPVCGRNFEYFSEDPFHSGELGVAYVRGLQRNGVGASLKHFAANNQETERTRISVVADDRTLREIYLEAFRRVVNRADPWTVMCSYNSINGVPASENHWLLTKVLRDEWGYTGCVVSDWDAVKNRVRSLTAGLDLEMPGQGGVTDAEIVAAVRSDEISMELVDRAARNVLTLVARTAQTTPSPPFYVDAAPGSPLTDSDRRRLRADEHHEVARATAESALVLLRNTESAGEPALPLARGSNSIAVIGAFAEHFRAQGGGSSGVDTIWLDAPLGRIREVASGPIAYAPGYVHIPLNSYLDDLPAYLAAHGADPTGGVADPAHRADALAESIRLAAIANDLVQGPPSGPAQSLIDDAVRVAATAETIIAFVGLPLFAEQEAADRTTLALPSDQLALLKRLAAVRHRSGARLIVVVSAGSAIDMSGWHDDTDAILYALLPGQAGGSAVADALFGLVNPSGKLAETFPLALADSPGWVTFPGERGQVIYGEGVFIGYRWYDALGKDVRYPFGHGLSYTTFTYSDLQVTIRDATAGDVFVAVTVTNTGPTPGREVVQLYVGDPVAVVKRPPRELKGFEKTAPLAPGESVTVGFELDNSAFTYWDSVLNGWRREGGEFRIELGSSSRDIRLAQSIHLPDDTTIDPLIPDSELGAATTSRFTAGHRG